MEGIVSAILNQPADMPTSYGVEIPNTDGRAGMIAIPVRDEAEVDLDKLQAGVTEQLPKYARPMFVRIIKEVQMTSEDFVAVLQGWAKEWSLGCVNPTS